MAIHAEGELTLGDVWRGSMLRARTMAAIFAVFGVVTLFLATSAAFLRSSALGGWRNQLTLAIIGLFWIAYYPLAILYRCSRNLKSSAFQGLGRYEFNPDGYTRELPQSRGEVKWNTIMKWREGKESFLFYPSPKSVIVIPKRFFQNAGDVSALRTILQAKIPRR